MSLNLPFGVRVADNSPLDADRYIAADIAARNSVVTQGRAYEGLQIYVESEKLLYILKGSTNADWEVQGGSPDLKIATFVATQGQSSFTVPENVIADDGKYSVNVNGQGWNSTNGTISFVGGNVTISFATGIILFNIALDEGDQVIIKYN